MSLLGLVVVNLFQTRGVSEIAISQIVRSCNLRRKEPCNLVVILAANTAESCHVLVSLGCGQSLADMPWNLRNRDLTNREILQSTTESTWQFSCSLATNTAKSKFTTRKIVEIAKDMFGKVSRDFRDSTEFVVYTICCSPLWHDYFGFVQH